MPKCHMYCIQKGFDNIIRHAFKKLNNNQCFYGNKLKGSFSIKKYVCAFFPIYTQLQKKRTSYMHLL